METSDYLPMFLAEGREHLQELNLAVVRIEERPGDQETVDEIFRIAHSMKGMAATMGFDGMAALTHEMEDVFELLRRRTDGLGREAAPDVPVNIVGTDLDRRMVERARSGEFSAEDARTAPAALMHRHFEPLEGGAWRATRALRTMVRFEQGDLLRMPVPKGRYDLIMCRNTVIYFTDEVRDALHARLASTLRPGGVLVVGGTERVADADRLGLELIAPFTYRRAA